MLNHFINNQIIMKTNQLILATLALVALAACTKDNVVNVTTPDNEIGFNAVTQRATKANDAIISGATYGTDNTFQLWGWQSEAGDFSEFLDDASSNFMSNITISWCGGPQSRANAWRNSEYYYYWPFTGKLSFLAIHPSTVAPTSTGWDEDNDVPQAAINDYTIDTDPETTNETVDLMFATNEGTRTSVLAGDGKVGLVFKHALSQIEVKVKTNENYSHDVTFDVESVTFHNIDLSGDVTYINDAIAWTDNTTQTVDWVYYNTVKEGITNAYQTYGAPKVNIPQPANAETTITIGYSMTQHESDKITGTVTISKPQLWEAGKKYNYTINFRLNEILFNPSVTDWVDVNVETITIY